MTFSQKEWQTEYPVESPRVFGGGGAATKGLLLTLLGVDDVASLEMERSLKFFK